MKRFFLCVLMAAGIQGACFAATYYVDYMAADDSANGTTMLTPWKRCPGMAGFAGSYSHAAGDQFIFKGGVTWPSTCLPLRISYSGSVGAVDTYTTNRDWYAGGSWTKPTFDGQGNGAIIGEHLLYASGKSYFKIDDINFINLHSASSSGAGYTLDLPNCQHVEFSRCNVSPEAWIGLYNYSENAGVYTDFTVRDCDFSHVGMAICPVVTGTGITQTNWSIHNNRFHDFASQLDGGVHGDGIHSWVNSDTSQISGVDIYNNYFYGSVRSSDGTSWMTGWVQLTDRTNHTRIYNNVFTFSDTSNNVNALFRAMVSIHGYGTSSSNYHYIYNNTFIGHDYPAVTMSIGAAIDFWGTNPDYVYIKNNVITGFRLNYSFTGTPANVVIDYNCLKNADASNFGIWGNVWRTKAQWVASGFDSHGVMLDPKLNADYSLSSSSPCIGTGANLGIEFGQDINDATRPSIDPWDIGAFQSQGSTARPIAPSGLRVK